MNLTNSLHECDREQDRQEILERPNCDHCDEEGDKKSLSKAIEQKEQDVNETAPLVRFAPATDSLGRDIPQTSIQSDSGHETSR